MRFPAPDAEARVRRGAALLDERRPGWASQIDVSKLKLSSNFNCVLGQLYGHFNHGVDVLGLSKQNTVRHGFFTGIFSRSRAGWSRLTELWIKEIESRRD